MNEEISGPESPAPLSQGLTRRELLQRGGLLAVAVFVPLGCRQSSAPAIAVPLDRAGAAFLSNAEMATLRAVVDRLIPPDDLAVGGAEVGCADGIEALLSAFSVDPPRIFAGGPFSDRGGATVNNFAQFIPLDAYEALAWRLRIEGSQERPEFEFNGPITGLQQVYRDGLAALGEGFASASPVAQELQLRGSDPAVQALVDVAFPHCLQFMYGAPEYGGNRDLKGWQFTDYDGDVQPRGYTAAEVEEGGSLLDVLDLAGVTAAAPWIALAPLAAPETLHGLLMQSDGRLGVLAQQVQAALDAAQVKAEGAP